MIAISDVPSTQQEMILDFDKTEDPASPSLPPTPILSPKHPPRPYTYTPEALAWFNEIKWTEDGFERMEISAVIRLAAIGSEDGGRADRDKDERGEEGRTMMEFGQSRVVIAILLHLASPLLRTTHITFSLCLILPYRSTPPSTSI